MSHVSEYLPWVVNTSESRLTAKYGGGVKTTRVIRPHNLLSTSSFTGAGWTQNIGTNDCATDDITAGFKTDLQTEITRLTSAYDGVRIHIVETTGRTDADYDARIQQTNIYKSELADENSKVFIVSAYDAFGGSSPTMLSDGIHPDADGFIYLAVACAQSIFNHM